jgi:hypothetical protein
LRLGDTRGTKLIYDNQAVMHIASNPVFTKEPNTEIDCHFVREVLSGKITTDFVRSYDNLAACSPNSLEALKFITFVTSLEHLTYMLQFEGEC